MTPDLDHPCALELDDVTLEFDAGRPVLKNCSLGVPTGKTKVILGASGAGKSTILRLALGLLKPTRGRVRLFGTDITDLSEEALRPFRTRMGMVFQGGALFDSKTVAQNVAFPLMEYENMTFEEAEPIVRRRLKYVGLEHAFSLMPAELSGGMIKRAAIARAVAPRPKIMLYDEATSGLDPSTTQRLLDLINGLRNDFNVTSVLVTHILPDAEAVADSIALLSDGEVVFDGTSRELFATDHPKVRAFLANRGVVHG